MSTDTTATLTYIGKPGSGLGFQLAGMEIRSCQDGAELVQLLTKLKVEQPQGIIFVDEGLAQDVLDDVERLNEDTLPAIVLLSDPVNEMQVSAKRLEQLLIKAVGSDIFNNE